MEHQILPPTVYIPDMPGRARSQKLNTIIEERQSWTSANQGMIEATKDPPTTSPVSDEFPTPRANGFVTNSMSPSSSLNSTTLTWTSSDTRHPGPVPDDDLYDVSDDETDRARLKTLKGGDAYGEYDAEADIEGGHIPIVIVRRLKSLSEPDNQSRPESPRVSRDRLPSLTIPDVRYGTGMQERRKTSPVTPMPPAKIPISPAVLSLLTQDPPHSTAPPSLDGSLTSDQLANSTSPSTPLMDSSEGEQRDWGSGVQLNPEAMATLRFLSATEEEAEEEDHAEPSIEVSGPENDHQQPSAPPTVRHDSSESANSCSTLTLVKPYSLEIPSPGGFFSSLADTSRHTWAPPSSSTAEHFYMAPWNTPEWEAVEQSLDLDVVRSGPSSNATLHGPQLLLSLGSIASLTDPTSSTNLGPDYDEEYEEGLKAGATSSLDRTSLWLHEQTDFLAKLREAIDPSTTNQKMSPQAKASPKISDSPASKKSVRFSDNVIESAGQAVAAGLATETGVVKPDPVFLRGFLYLMHTSRRRDAMLYGHPRYDAVNIRRSCAPTAHRDQLLGKYQVLEKPLTADPDESPTLEHKQTVKAEKERSALEQMNISVWQVMAAKALNGGTLLNSPAARRFTRIPDQTPSRLTVRRRILDLGGQSVCDWAWHCAEDFPNSKVYTVVDKSLRQMTYSTLRGPPNHRQVAVPYLWRLPFPDGYFEVISARSLYLFLKTYKPNGEDRDEYDLCLGECIRCLKPGGYLEYVVLDSDIMGAGPKGSAMAVEFGFSLKARGYDPTPTRDWIKRLRKAGFGTIKRSWIILPMGAKMSPRGSVTDQGESMGSSGESTPREKTGASCSAADISNLSGLVGSLAWEKWMLKLQMENGKPQDSLLEGVSSVIQEGRECGAAWRCLTGWARKPLDMFS